MEALMLFLDAIAILVLCYGGLIDDKRGRNVKQRSLFRFVDNPDDRKKKPKPGVFQPGNLRR